MPIIPAIQEVEIGGSQSKTRPGRQKQRPYLKNKVKEAGAWLKW
jgi:hypothetical protein